jgi:hypothetical protein
MDTTTNTCTKCKKIKDMGQFLNKKGTAYTKHCQSCRNTSDNWKKNNAEQNKIQQKGYREGLSKEEVKEEYKKHGIEEKIKISPNRKLNIIKDGRVYKECSKCLEELPVEEFSINPSHHTGLRAQCKRCDCEYRNKPDVMEKNKKYNKLYWLKTNKVLERLRRKKWRSENKEYLSKYRKDYIPKWEKHKRATDPIFQLKKNLRCRVWHALTNQGATKNRTTMDLIGCTPEFLWDHLIKQFKPGMTIENYGEWHVDHIKPCSRFDLSKKEEQAKCFHYSNLQPLWASENCSKGAKYEEPQNDDFIRQEFTNEEIEQLKELEDSDIAESIDILMNLDNEDMEQLINDLDKEFE